MPDLEGQGSVPAESSPVATIELGPDLSIYGDGVGAALDDPSTESAATVEQTQEEPTAPDQPAEPGQVAVPEPVAESTEVAEERSRRERWEAQNQEYVDRVRAEARAEAEAAIAEAEKARQDKADADARQARIREQAEQWMPPREHYTAVDSALKRGDWDALDATEWTDNDGARRRGFSTERDVLNYLSALDQRSEQAQSMFSHVRDVFRGATAQWWNAMADRPGIDKSVLLGPDIGKSLEHLYEAGRASERSEWEPKYEALKKEYDGLRARAGSLTPSPESGGQGASGGAWTQERYEAAVLSGEMNKKTPEERDRIIQQMWEADPRGR